MNYRGQYNEQQPAKYTQRVYTCIFFFLKKMFLKKHKIVIDFYFATNVPM